MKDHRTLGEAREYVQINRKEGVRCPCCDIWTKINPRNIYKGAVESLIGLYRLHQEDPTFHHVSTFDFKWWIDKQKTERVPGRGDFAKLRYWHLIRPQIIDGHWGQGMWKITPRGIDWLEGKITVTKYALILDSECIGFEGPEWGVEDAWDEPFDLEKMMAYEIQSDVP